MSINARAIIAFFINTVLCHSFKEKHFDYIILCNMKKKKKYNCDSQLIGDE